MKAIQWIISALVAVVIIAAAVGGGVYFTHADVIVVDPPRKGCEESVLSPQAHPPYP